MPGPFPFLTSYDPPGTSEGTLDPLGLYQIADQLAVQLVPAVRERMTRIRFLTAMTLGTLVTEGLENNPEKRDASPYLVWEWLVIEALMRSYRGGESPFGIPGSLVTRRAIAHSGYLDAKSYLKTPRIFGFNGVYKRLAVHLGLVDVHLGPGPHAEPLATAWARGLGHSGLAACRALLSRWKDSIVRSLAEKPPRTRPGPGWTNVNWAGLATAFDPEGARTVEKRHLRDQLLGSCGRPLGAFPDIWALQDGFGDDDYAEEVLHEKLETQSPQYRDLLRTIRAYERFARRLQDAFDLLRAEASFQDARGFAVSDMTKSSAFCKCVKGLDQYFSRAHGLLGGLGSQGLLLQALFNERFRSFSDPMDVAACALTLCTHHEVIQRSKSADGKRSWFDRPGPDRIFMRQSYRIPMVEPLPDRYVHSYRAGPIRRFWQDLK